MSVLLYSVRKRWVTALFLVAVLSAITGSAVATNLIHDGDENPVPEFLDVRNVASYTTSWGQIAQIFTANTASGESCEIYRVADGSVASASFDDALRVCFLKAPGTPPPVQLGINWYADGRGQFNILVNGKLNRAVDRAALVTPGGGEVPIDIGDDGYFYVELPASPVASALAPESAGAAIVGLNTNGAEVVRANLEEWVAAAARAAAAAPKG